MKKMKTTSDDEILVYVEKSNRRIEQSIRDALTPEKKAELRNASEQTRKEILWGLELDAALAHNQNMALALIAKFPSGPWGDEAWETIRDSEGDEGFFRKIAQTIRKAKQGIDRKALIDQNEMLLIAHWREVVIGNKTLPGLEAWSWDAMADFLSSIGKNKLSAQAWSKIAARAGLRQSTIKIAKFAASNRYPANKIAAFLITFRGPKKQTIKISAAP